MGRIVTSLLFTNFQEMGTFKLKTDFIGKQMGDIIQVADYLDNDMIRFGYGVKIDESKIDKSKVDVPAINKAVVPAYNPKNKKR